jgi:transcriptional regulator with XRE-family HTH domain
MDQQTIIADIEARARAKGLTIQELCARAGIHPTTFSRWKKSEKNPEPIGATMKLLERLDATIKAAADQQAAA